MRDDQDNASQGGRSARLSGVALRVGSLGVLWVALARGETLDSWYLGLPTVVLATVASYRLVPRPGGRVHLWGLLRFVPFFVRKSLAGGVDVGLRALRPSMPLQPGLVHYELRMRSEVVAAVFFVGVISLLPGTLCAALREGQVVVHVVDRTLPIEEELAELEERVADVFGEPLVGEDMGPPSGREAT